MKQKIARLLMVLIAGLLLPSALQIQAATTYVGWDSATGFSPVMVTVNPGDTVVWIDNDALFSSYVTSDVSFGNANYFQIPLFNEGDAYGVVFNSLGTFGYHDDFGNNGSVTVTTATAAISLLTAQITGNLFLFDATGLGAGKTNVLETSTSLIVWTPVQTNVASGSSISFTNPVIAGSHFYRLRQLP